MRKVVDSWALMEWMQEQPAAGKVQAIFEDAAAGKLDLCMSMINVGEVFYLLYKRLGQSKAEAFLEGLPSLPLRIPVPSADGILEAARIKANHPISYADSFAVAAALSRTAALVTGDPDLKALSGVIEIDWIGD